MNTDDVQKGFDTLLEETNGEYPTLISNSRKLLNDLRNIAKKGGSI